MHQRIAAELDRRFFCCDGIFVDSLAFRSVFSCKNHHRYRAAEIRAIAAICASIRKQNVFHILRSGSLGSGNGIIPTDIGSCDFIIDRLPIPPVRKGEVVGAVRRVSGAQPYDAFRPSIGGMGTPTIVDIGPSILPLRVQVHGKGGIADADGIDLQVHRKASNGFSVFVSHQGNRGILITFHLVSRVLLVHGFRENPGGNVGTGFCFLRRRIIPFKSL